MEKHSAVLIACLLSCLLWSTSAMPVPTSEVMKAPVPSLSEVTGNESEQGYLLPANSNPYLNSNADNLVTRKDEAEDASDDAVILRHLAETRTNRDGKSLIQKEKRRLRLMKRRESGNRKTLAEQESQRHSLHKREAEYRDRRTWSISNALSVLTDMVVETQQRRLAEEREAMKRRLLELGKRSGDSSAGKIDTLNRKEQDIVSFLQAALSSAESN
ncbi:unnamed protein product [Candidula unifasciata]|uniref:Uncharacterized protein n=1 Tax=Candidula unifasciata TaxID=100452 RepID=A0A8S3YS24_9EUPU|nr:unnamed protein product [Candidula unifasciata]